MLFSYGYKKLMDLNLLCFVCLLLFIDLNPWMIANTAVTNDVDTKHAHFLPCLAS